MKRMLSVGSLAFALTLALVGPVSASVSSFTVDGTANLSASKIEATVTGTIVCSVGDTFSVAADIFQNSGKTDTFGAGFTGDLICTGAVQSWSLTAPVLIGTSYKHGPASLIAAASDSTDSTDSGILTTGIKIH
jgi:hypothetical protein